MFSTRLVGTPQYVDWNGDGALDRHDFSGDRIWLFLWHIMEATFAFFGSKEYSFLVR